MYWSRNLRKHVRLAKNGTRVSSCLQIAIYYTRREPSLSIPSTFCSFVVTMACIDEINATVKKVFVTEIFCRRTYQTDFGTATYETYVFDTARSVRQRISLHDFDQVPTCVTVGWYSSRETAWICDWSRRGTTRYL